jgi:hypothetical protein
VGESCWNSVLERKNKISIAPILAIKIIKGGVKLFLLMRRTHIRGRFAFKFPIKT